MDKAQLSINLLRDEFFMGEMKAIKDNCLQQIVNSNESDVNVREDYYRLHKQIDLVISHFQSLADSKQIDSKRWKIF